MQSSFSELEYAAKKRQTRRDRFLAEIEAVTPWSFLTKVISPYYPSSGGRGRPPVGLERILRMYIAQQCFGLSDEGVEDALYDSQAIRRFVGIDLNREAALDATTLLKFRHLLEAHQLTESIFNAINAHLAEQGLFLRDGTIVDATLIAAPPSTKNKEGKRDEEMHQTKKGNQWYSGMKAHIGVDPRLFIRDFPWLTEGLASALTRLASKAGRRQVATWWASSFFFQICGKCTFLGGSPESALRSSAAPVPGSTRCRSIYMCLVAK